jgi:hypothetical protein
VLQDRPQRMRAEQLRAQLLVAAGRAADDRRAAADAHVDGVIGGGVAGVQRDHHVHRARRIAAHVALLEAQALQAEPADDAVAQAHHVGADSTPVTCASRPSACAGGRAAQRSGSPCPSRSPAPRCAAASARGCRFSAAPITSRNLLICFHLRAIAGTSASRTVTRSRSGSPPTGLDSSSLTKLPSTQAVCSRRLKRCRASALGGRRGADQVGEHRGAGLEGRF